MSRVERIGDATLYLGRCEDLLGDLPTDALLLTDPPYGIGTETEKPSRRVRPYARSGDSPRTVATIRPDFRPVHGDSRPFDPSQLLTFKFAVLWGANHYSAWLPSSACWFAWDRKAGRAADTDITDCELAWTRGLPFKTVRLFRHMWAGFQRDSEVGERHLHPTQKPVALMRWCLSFFPDADVVIDPYMGSGPVGIACVTGGRSYIGIECDEGHFNTAVRRLSDAVRQRDLFVPAPAPAPPEDARIEDLFREPESVATLGD